MKVLVTGATGFLGRHVVPRLLDRGHEVVAVSRDETKARRFEWYGRVRHVPCDVHAFTGNPPDWFGNPDAVIHLAWTGLPNYRSLFHFEENLPGDCRFLKSLVMAGVRHLLVTGTCFEYGMKNGCLAEGLATDPANAYGIAKDALRRFLFALQAEKPFQLQWARLFYLYGEGQNPNSLIAQLDRAIDAADVSFDMSSGEQLRDYLPVTSVADHLVALLARPGQQGIINVCSGEPISVRRLAETHIAARAAAIRLNLGRYPYPDHEPMAFWGNATRLRNALETAPSVAAENCAPAPSSGSAAASIGARP